MATSVRAEEGHEYPEASPYAEMPEIAATARIMAARTQAMVEGKRLIAIFGANWCHDSRALAGWLDTARFKNLTDRNFVVVFVDAGRPQDGEGRNLDLAAGFGVSDVEGTPNLLVIDPASGKLLNSPQSAKSWRDAASRSEDAIYNELAGFAAPAG
ncbi:thioredoxin family protein [Parerythrobacter lacustris]|uniref:Thioredoxin family protein n=1 Tax=Parerythrobacter lacustris TaxID=2969984 RepID=A0ABT1XM06_9SPHN|nr:thioredoxin family protein [Parerythrobacter lacustris]MCR2832698.1 thioredoxin family protein [Parerythrobacter lacustris]